MFQISRILYSENYLFFWPQPVGLMCIQLTFVARCTKFRVFFLLVAYDVCVCLCNIIILDVHLFACVCDYLYESYSWQRVARWLSKTRMLARRIEWWWEKVHTAIVNRSMRTGQWFFRIPWTVFRTSPWKIAEVPGNRLPKIVYKICFETQNGAEICNLEPPNPPSKKSQADPQRLDYHLFHALTTEVLANELKLSLQVKGSANVEGPLGIRLLIRLECTIHCAVEKLFDPPARHEVVQSKECQYKYFWGP